MYIIVEKIIIIRPVYIVVVNSTRHFRLNIPNYVNML